MRSISGITGETGKLRGLYDHDMYTPIRASSLNILWLLVILVDRCRTDRPSHPQDKKSEVLRTCFRHCKRKPDTLGRSCLFPALRFSRFSIYKQMEAKRSNDPAPSDLFLACCSAAFVQLCLQADAAAISDASLSSTGFSACACCCFCCPQQARAFGTAPAFHAFPQLACSPKPCTPSRCRGLR